jgi:hypothetical protein
MFDGLWNMFIKLLDKIKSVFKINYKIETEKIIITQKSCPHCASRGMFVFNNNSKTKTKIGDSNEKHK